MKLSILIPTIKEREESFFRVKSILDSQIQKDNLGGYIEVLSICDNREKTTGEKRNILKAMAKGEYISFVDDDDRVDVGYCIEILNAISMTKADVITFKMLKDIDSKESNVVRFSKFMQEGQLNNTFILKPYHICPHKKELADKIKFPHTSFLEDYNYMIELDKITNTESYINKILYFYDYKSSELLRTL